jgi:hypothetical protein
MEWHCVTLLKKKVRTIPLAGKIIGTVFWNAEGFCPERKLSMQSDSLDTLETMTFCSPVIIRHITLQHDNAYPHTAHWGELKSLAGRCFPIPPTTWT